MASKLDSESFQETSWYGRHVTITLQNEQEITGRFDGIEHGMVQLLKGNKDNYQYDCAIPLATIIIIEAK